MELAVEVLIDQVVHVLRLLVMDRLNSELSCSAWCWNLIRNIVGGVQDVEVSGLRIADVVLGHAVTRGQLAVWFGRHLE